MFRKLLCGVLAIGMAGCVGDDLFVRMNNKETFRHQRSSVVDLDASRRGLVGNWSLVERDGSFVEIRNGRGENYYLHEMRICAEQFPDIFTVAATQLSANSDAQIEPKDVAARLAIAASRSENGATIQRTQTVNLLREMMYRTCERYMSGAIGSDELAVQAARDVQAMVSVLAIEQLTGSITPDATVLGASSRGSATSASLSAMAAVIEERNEAEEAVNEARQAATASLDGEENCDAVPEDDGKRATCETSQANLTSAQNRLTAAEQAMEVTVAAVAQQVQSEASVANLSPSQSSASAKAEVVRATAVAEVAGAVERIVLMNRHSADGSVPCEAILMREHSFAKKEKSQARAAVAAPSGGGAQDAPALVARDRAAAYLVDRCFEILSQTRQEFASLYDTSFGGGCSDCQEQSRPSEQRNNVGLTDLLFGSTAQGNWIDVIVTESYPEDEFDRIITRLETDFPRVYSSPSYASNIPAILQVEYYLPDNEPLARRVAANLAAAGGLDGNGACVTRGNYLLSDGVGEINVSVPNAYRVTDTVGSSVDPASIAACRE